MGESKLFYALWTNQIPEGEVRRLLKYQVKYYFGGGLPGALPTQKLAEILRQIADELLQEISAGKSAHALQLFNYGKTAGTDSLRKRLLSLLIQRQQLPFDAERDYHKMLITAGSQQSLYGILDSVVNPGDYVLSAGPSYLGFVTPAVKLGARVVLCRSDDSGLTAQGVEQAIAAVKRACGQPPKLLYVIPDSDNPTGITLPEDRREAFFHICRRENILLVEDAAYKEIQFGDTRLKPIKTWDAENQVVAYLASTSKEAGVLRLGYSLLPEPLRERLEKAKGYYDLCCPAITQEIADRYYSLDIDAILKDVLAIYRERCQAMIEGITQFFPEGKFTRPNGGFFVWWESLAGREFDAKRFNEEVAIPNQLLFVPSRAFFPPRAFCVNHAGNLIEFTPPGNGMRLSFSAIPRKLIYQGLEKLGYLLGKELS